MVAVAHERSLDLQPSQRVGPVEHHHRDARLGAAAHHQSERGDEGVGAAAHVLDVIDHDVHALEHLFRGLAGVAEKRMHRQAGVRVFAGIDLAAGIHVPAHAMLGSVEGDQLHVGRLEKDVDRGTQFPVHAGGVGHQADPLALQACEMTFPEDLDARFDDGADLLRGRCGGSLGALGRGPGGLGRGGGGTGRAYEEQRRRAKNVTKTVARQHIITTIKNPT